VFEFTLQLNLPRVLFGAGMASKLGDEIERLDARRALLVCTALQADSARSVVEPLGQRIVGVFDRAVMHVPIETAREAIDLARDLRADCIVAVGGGSTTGLAKAIALESDLAVLAIPTTYAGSEMTPIYGLTENSLKRTGRDLRVLPKTVIYDPLLTLSLAATLSLTSGINALAHAIEGLYAENANPIISALALEGIHALAHNLPDVVANGSNLEARAQCLYGAWLCGCVLGNVGMALHHKLCHTLGGSFNLPHAETHTVVLPHVLAYNAHAAAGPLERASHALGGVNAARAIFALSANHGGPTSLAALGLEESDLDQVTELALASPYYNPRPVTRDGIRALLDDAYFGRPPKA
jgi:maleylacetate reductase